MAVLAAATTDCDWPGRRAGAGEIVTVFEHEPAFPALCCWLTAVQLFWNPSASRVPRTFMSLMLCFSVGKEPGRDATRKSE